MEPTLLGLLGLVSLVILIIIRIPIAYAMIIVGGVGITLLNGPTLVLNQLKTLAYGQFSIYSLSVVPVFILMGALAAETGLSRALFRAANAYLGWLRGGTAMAAVTACAGFGAVCGSSLATASTMGRIAIPELQRYRYSGALATGSVAAGGVLGILIPPSVVLVIYAILVEANIVTMFMAALVPGLIAVLFFILTIALYVLLVPGAGPKGTQSGRHELVEATLGMLPVVVIFTVVLGGIYLGFYNPTPAASVGVFLVALYGLVTRSLTRAACLRALQETAGTTGMIYLILLGAELMKVFFARIEMPQQTALWIIESGITPFMVMAVLLLALIMLGCLMDSLSMILLVIPFFWPVLVDINGGLYQGAEGSGFGMSTNDLKIWFGILALIVVELGLITPPVGLNVFVISAIARDVPMIETFKGVMPFFVAELVRVVLLFSVPAITLWLPGVLSG